MSTRNRRTTNVTIKDVAQEAGVSHSTVSRVLNNNPHVKPEKRKRVLDAMTRLGYVVNQQARSLAGGRSQVIGVLVHDLGTPYTAEVLYGIEEELATAQYDLMLYTTHRRKTRESIYVNTLTRGMTDGLLLLLPLNPGAYLETLRQQQFPYVVIDNQGFDDFSPTVFADNLYGATAAMRYLIELGHRRIGFIMGSTEIQSAIHRLEAYKAVLAEAGIAFDPALVVEGDFTQNGGYEATRDLLDLAEPPTAIFAGNDLSAFGAIELIRSRDLSIPGDISIIGFDDLPQAATTHPALTTVRQPLRQMGRIAAQMLLEYIQNPQQSPASVVLETQLVTRASCAPILAANANGHDSGQSKLYSHRKEANKQDIP